MESWLLAVLVLPPALLTVPLVLAGIERRLVEGRRPPQVDEVSVPPPLARTSGEHPVLPREV